MVKHFTDDNWQTEVIEASQTKPVLVDFFAVWCGPCKMQAPIIEEVDEALGEQAVVGAVNTEEAAKVAEEYGIMSIPTLMIFRQGQPVKTYVGVQPREILVADLRAAVA